MGGILPLNGAGGAKGHRLDGTMLQGRVKEQMGEVFRRGPISGIPVRITMGFPMELVEVPAKVFTEHAERQLDDAYWKARQMLATHGLVEADGTWSIEDPVFVGPVVTQALVWTPKSSARKPLATAPVVLAS